MTSYVGWLAAVVASVMFVPQVARTWRRRNDPDELAGISLPSFGLVMLSGSLWMAYGIMLSDVQIVVTNALIWLATSGMIAMVVRGRTTTPKSR